jgi:ABC-type multidrug transport system permease subunit
MRFFRIIQKNFKVLSRSRSSAFILFVGPILILALVGFFFSGKSTYDLSIGYFAPRATPLTNQFIDSLKQGDFIVYKFGSEEDCVVKIKQGIVHTCIVFPPGFEVGDASSGELRFIVDYSRINLVYKIIDSVSGIIGAESKQVSYSLTSVLLSNINMTIRDLRQEESLEANISVSQSGLKEEAARALRTASEMQFESQQISSHNLEKNIVWVNSTFVEFKSKAADLMNATLTIWEALDGYIDENESASILSEIKSINQSLSEIDNMSVYRIGLLYSSFSDLNRSLAEVAEQIAGNMQLNDAVKVSLSRSADLLDSLKKDTALLVASTSSTRRILEGIDVTRADTIVSPVRTRIEPLVSESSNIQVTFPFLVVLIVMFVSLMIASTLVIFEKNSRALFRNFLAPISDRAFILASFATVLVIVILQGLIILLISQFALKLNLFSNFVPVFSILFVATLFFVVAGMLIGHLFSSQEGAVMASLVLGSSFLFISNLVVPLESVASGLSGIIQYNPFIIFSDLLRKALLFSMPIGDAVLSLGTLLLISLFVLAIFLITKGFFTRHKVRMPGRKE